MHSLLQIAIKSNMSKLCFLTAYLFSCCCVVFGMKCLRHRVMHLIFEREMWKQCVVSWMEINRNYTWWNLTKTNLTTILLLYKCFFLNEVEKINSKLKLYLKYLFNHITFDFIVKIPFIWTKARRQERLVQACVLVKGRSHILSIKRAMNLFCFTWSLTTLSNAKHWPRRRTVDL